MNFCQRFLRLSVFPWCKDRPLIVMLWWKWLGRLNCRATCFDASVSLFSTSHVFAKAVRQSSPCFAYVDFLAYCAGYAIDDIYGDACKVGSDFSGSIWSWDLKHVRNRGQILHRVQKKNDWLTASTNTCGMPKKSTQMRQNHTLSTGNQWTPVIPFIYSQIHVTSFYQCQSSSTPS